MLLTKCTLTFNSNIILRECFEIVVISRITSWGAQFKSELRELSELVLTNAIDGQQEVQK